MLNADTCECPWGHRGYIQGQIEHTHKHTHNTCTCIQLCAYLLPTGCVVTLWVLVAMTEMGNESISS